MCVRKIAGATPEPEEVCVNGSLLSRLPYAPHLAALVLRVAVGTVLIAHGLQKLRGGVSGFAGVVESVGAPFPTLTAYVVVAIEVLGGSLLLVGLLTRVWSTLAALFMVFTTLLVKLDSGLIAPQGQGSGAELDILILAGALAITLMGPGTVSLDRLIGIDGARLVPGDQSKAPNASVSGAK